MSNEQLYASPVAPAGPPPAGSIVISRDGDRLIGMYRDVYGHFLHTLDIHGYGWSKGYKVDSIQCVVNPLRFQMYTLKAKQMEMENQSDSSFDISEYFLFHGTSYDKVNTIIDNNFSRDFTTACAYGKGVYFAVNRTIALTQ